MVEEATAPKEELDPNAAPESGETAQDPPQDETPEAIVELARKAGWTPKEEFRGDPEKWRPADEYLLVGKDRISSMSRDLKGLRDQIGRMSSVSSQLLTDKIAERDAYWQRVHAKAVEDGDGALAEQAVDERMKLKTQAPQPANDVPPETTDFIQRHRTWFGVDPLATAHAKQIAAQLAQEGHPPAVQLREAERSVRKTFPELFPQSKPAPGVAATRTRTAGLGSRAKGYNDMPEESRRMADDYERRHGVKKDDFAKSYWAEQAATPERKVG